jgi:ubiquinone/menaquinone biosynthesis C-methylase UbiE
VDNLDKTIAEIIRVVAPGGDFLLLVVVNHPLTRCEPITFSWDITEKFLGELELLEEKHYEVVPPGYMRESIKEGGPYNHSDPTERTGILAARFRKLCR